MVSRWRSVARRQPQTALAVSAATACESSVFQNIMIRRERPVFAAPLTASFHAISPRKAVPARTWKPDPDTFHNNPDNTGAISYNPIAGMRG